MGIRGDANGNGKIPFFLYLQYVGHLIRIPTHIYWFMVCGFLFWSSPFVFSYQYFKIVLFFEKNKREKQFKNLNTVYILIFLIIQACDSKERDNLGGIWCPGGIS